MISDPSPNAPELAVKHICEYRYRQALDNAKRCRRLARHVTDDQLCIDLEQLASDYETLASRLHRH